jgi:hypothetical protein
MSSALVHLIISLSECLLQALLLRNQYSFFHITCSLSLAVILHQVRNKYDVSDTSIDFFYGYHKCRLLRKVLVDKNILFGNN